MVLLAILLATGALWVFFFVGVKRDMIASDIGPEFPRSQTHELPRGKGGDADGEDGRPIGVRGSSSRVAIYDPDVPLRAQTDKLRRLSDGGNPYATCVLSYALQMCFGGADRTAFGDPPNVDLATLGMKDADEYAVAIEYWDRHKTTCSGLEKTDFIDLNKRLLMSAKHGHARSMADFAQLSTLLSSSVESEGPILERDNALLAEPMLNRAAERGDLHALNGVAAAYRDGHISSIFGFHPVRKDEAKALAAWYAASRLAPPEEMALIDEQILAGKNRLSQAEKIRFRSLSARYERARSARSPRRNDGIGFSEEYPEVICRDL
ncbi:MAG: hypothetical protein V4673_15980 [Pseudomonadota bacterium]